MDSLSNSSSHITNTPVAQTEAPKEVNEQRERLAKCLQVTWVVLTGNTVKGMTPEEAESLAERVKKETEDKLFKNLIQEVASVASDPLHRASMCLFLQGQEIDLSERVGLCANIENLLQKYNQ